MCHVTNCHIYISIYLTGDKHIYSYVNLLSIYILGILEWFEVSKCHVSNISIHISIYYLYIYLSINLSIDLSIYLSIYVYIYLLGILKWFEVSNCHVTNVSPVEFACESVQAKNTELRTLINQYSANQVK